MKYKPEYPPGSTPLDPDELGGLIPKYITTQGELTHPVRWIDPPDGDRTAV